MTTTTCGKKFTVVVHFDDKCNKFWVYRYSYVWNETQKRYKQRKTLEVKYADMRSCLAWLTCQF